MYFLDGRSSVGFLGMESLIMFGRRVLVLARGEVVHHIRISKVKIFRLNSI
jgi:hypothetical protein